MTDKTTQTPEQREIIAGLAIVKLISIVEDLEKRIEKLESFVKNGFVPFGEHD